MVILAPYKWVTAEIEHQVISVKSRSFKPGHVSPASSNCPSPGHDVIDTLLYSVIEIQFHTHYL